MADESKREDLPNQELILILERRLEFAHFYQNTLLPYQQLTIEVRKTIVGPWILHSKLNQRWCGQEELVEMIKELLEDMEKLAGKGEELDRVGK